MRYIIHFPLSNVMSNVRAKDTFFNVLYYENNLDFVLSNIELPEIRLVWLRRKLHLKGPI